MSSLLNHSERLAQRALCNFIQWNAVISNLTAAIRNIIKARQQVYRSCLTRTGRTNKRNFLTRLSVNTDIMQDSFFRLIAEGYVIKNNLSFQLAQ